NQTINELTALNVSATATDADLPANTLTFALVSGPAGLTVAANGAIAWTPSEAQGPSTNVVTVRVFDDGTPSLNATSSFTVVINLITCAPLRTARPSQTLRVGASLIVTNTAVDADIPAKLLTFSRVSAPAGMLIDSATGVITWTPPVSQQTST